MSGQDAEGVAHVGEIPICHGCGLMSHYVHDKAPLCGDCWRRRDLWQHQGMYKYVTENGDCKHETPLCPAVQGSTYYLTKDEMVYLDKQQCGRCDGYVMFDQFDWRQEAGLA